MLYSLSVRPVFNPQPGNTPNQPDCASVGQRKGGYIGLLDNLLGNASEVDARGLEDDLATLLVPGEEIDHAYRLW